MCVLQNVKAWVLFVDVYGFSALTNVEESDLLATKLIKVERTIHESPDFGLAHPRQYWFSDSTFLVYPVTSPEQNSSEVYKYLATDVCIMYEAFAECDLPIRGAAAFGQVTVDDRRVIGPPVIRAVNYERLSDLPLILVPATEFRQGVGPDQFPFLTPLERIQLRAGGGVMQGQFLVPRPAESYRELAAKHYHSTLVAGPYEVASVWERTLDRIDRGPQPVVNGID